MSSNRVLFVFVSPHGEAKVFLLPVLPDQDIEFMVLELLCRDDLERFTFIAAIHTSLRILSSKKSHYAWRPSAIQHMELHSKLVAAELERLRLAVK